MIYSVLASLNRLRPCGGPACEVMQCSTWYSPGCVRLESDSGWAGVPHWPLARQLGVNTRCCPANSITRRVLTPHSSQHVVVCCLLCDAMFEEIGWRLTSVLELQTVETSPPVRIILASKNRDEKIEAVKTGGGGGSSKTGEINLVWNSAQLKWRRWGGGRLERGIFFYFCLLALWR